MILAAVTGCGATPTTPPALTPDPACAGYERYGDLTGTRVTILESSADPQITAYRLFASCTGTTVVHQGEGSAVDRVLAGDPPDLVSVADPAALDALVRQTGAVVPAPSAVTAQIAEFYPETYASAGSVDGTLYGAPLATQVKSLVWYSPRVFTERGYTVPTTWDELLVLSTRIAADGGTPWCAADGAPLADFLEDAVLREEGPEVYDRWVTHAIPFNSAPVATALDGVGAILRNPGFGVGSGPCVLRRAAEPAGPDVAADGDEFAFPLPPRDATTDPTALVSGGFAVALSDRREVAALHAYLASPEWATEKGDEIPGWISANSGVPSDAVSDPVARLSVEVLRDPRVILRFDGSDLMPPSVGDGTLPAAMTGWLVGVDTATTLTSVEASWPP